MSNALSFISVPASLAAAAESPRQFQVVLIAVGLCVLIAWFIRRLLHPSKLKLRRAPGRGNRITPVHILVLLAVWIGVSAGIFKTLELFFAEGSPCPQLLAIVAGQMLFLIGGLIVAATTFRAGLVRGLGLSVRHWPWDTIRGVVAYLAVFPVCIGLLLLTIYFLPEKLIRQHELLTSIKTVSPFWQAVVIFSAVVLAPISEEIFFRGLFQSMIRKYTGRPWVAIITSAALFAVFHFACPQTIPALLALGIVLGYNYARTGRLLAPILIHAIFNTVTIISFMMTGA